MKYDCLIIDDEEALTQSTCEYFNMFGVRTEWVSDENGCADFFEKNTADLILLDINLGNTSGFDLCKRLRKTMNIPILFISARTSDDDMLIALNIGGDDYIKKPYSLAVLLAKVKAVLNRYSQSGKDADKDGNENTADKSEKESESENSGEYSFGNVNVNYGQRAVYVNGRKIELKAMEYKLLLYLIKNKNRVIPKDEIFRRVWEDSITMDNTLNVHIRRLREKIETNPNEPKYIKTVWGTGYLFEEVTT